MSDPYSFDIESAFLKANGKTLDQALDGVWQQTGFGSIKQAIGNSFYGINHRQTPASLGINRDYFGLTLFTRPYMNLSTDNIRAVRRFNALLTNKTQSLPRIVRCLLDPSLADLNKNAPTVTSPFVDAQQAFIPIFTNALVSCTGWPDLEAQTYTSHEGIMKEAMSFVDSSIELYGTYDITANFRNLPGDPIMAIIMTWLYYMSKVYLGDIIPYFDALVNNEIDYMTRIYRLVLDPSRRFVTKIAATGASFPTNAPYGAAINHDGDHPVNMNNQQLSIQFRSNTVQYDDPILIDEFNRVVAMFNHGMMESNFRTLNDGSETNTYYKQIPLQALDLFNNRGYPRINPYTYELSWWVDQGDWNTMFPVYNQMLSNGRIIVPQVALTDR